MLSLDLPLCSKCYHYKFNHDEKCLIPNCNCKGNNDKQ